jgi:hypothetical protein
MLDLIDEAFDQMSFTIQVPIIFSLHKPILFRRYYCHNAFGSDQCEQLIRVITLVSEQSLRLEAFNQASRLRRVMTLTGSQKNPQGIAQSINGNVNLGGKTAATSA